MGELLNAVKASPTSAGGQKPKLPAVLAALPDDAREDLLGLFMVETTNVAQLRRIVHEKYPDVPRYAESTWFKWAREYRKAHS